MEGTLSSSTSMRTSQSITGTAKVDKVNMATPQPFLALLEAESIRLFLRAYDAYCRELKSCAVQLLQEASMSLEPIRSVGLVYCVEAKQLESAVDLGMIDDCVDVKDLSDHKLRAFFDKEAVDSATVVTESDLSMVLKHARMDMSVKFATGLMKLLFIDYKSLLRQHGMAWVAKKNQKAAVRHVLSFVKPAQLKNRLEQDISFSKRHLKEDLRAFLKHALDLSEAFEKLDNENPRGRQSQSGGGSKNTGSKTKPEDKPASKTSKDRGNKRPASKTSKNRGNKRPPPSPCPMKACEGKNRMHWVDDCEHASAQEKKDFEDKLAAARACDGPARSTRSQVSSGVKAASSASKSVGHLCQDKAKTNMGDESPSYIMTVSDTKVSLNVTGRCDDGSDENIASTTLAERAVLKCIGKIEVVNNVSLEIALTKKDEKPRLYTFSRAWCVPATVLHLNSGGLALKNIRSLVANDVVACEDLLIGRPVLLQLRVDTRTLLEDRLATLDGTDCSPEPLPAIKGGRVSCIMVARLNGVSNDQEDSPPTVNPDRQKVNYFRAHAEKDPLPDPSLLDPIDLDQHEDIKAAVDHLQKAAFENGLAEDKPPCLAKLLAGHVDIFRISFSSGPPACLPPLKSELTPDAKPVKVRLRKYSKEQRDFLATFVKDLVRHGLAYPNPTSKWACAPLLVPKPGAQFRFESDIRPVNLYTIKHHYPMPNLEHELTKVGRSKYFANVDFSHRYWQLEAAKESQGSQSFITPDGIITPTRVLHGTTNAVTHVQSSIAGIILDDLKPYSLFWLDDVLLHAPTFDELLNSIESFFALCVEYNVKLHPGKCTLFATEVRWCGRLVSFEGIRYDPRRLEGLLTMEPPTSGAQLQQFVCALQWVKQGIPNFTDLVAPLHEFMERVYDHVDKRMKRAVSRVSLFNLGWVQTELDAFEACKHALAHQVTLAHRDVNQHLCVYTDASDTAWSGIVTQFPLIDVHKAHAEQRHSPLAFLSGHFNATQLGWSVLEKEAYAVLTTLDRMHWIVATPEGFDLYTDHKNLIFLFDPLYVVPDLSATSMRKVLRWAVRFSMYRYTCFLIKGNENVWADLLSRWTIQPNTVRRIVHVPEIQSSFAADFEWPSRSVISKDQQDHAFTCPEGLKLSDRVWTYKDTNAVWISDDAADLQLHLCVIAHTGPSGHRGRDATEALLSESFHWSTLQADVRTFVRACIHCLSTVRGERIPCPLVAAVHGIKPNYLLQFDYIELGLGKTGDKYVLVLRDDHSDYKWFFAYKNTNAENAASAIIDWCAAFGVPNGLMSDGPTNFKNEVVRLVFKGLKVPHHFTPPYCPWSNRTVDRLGKELVRVARGLLSELKMRTNEWPDLLPIFASVLNNSQFPSRGNVCQITAFMGREATPPIKTFLRSSTAKSVTLTDAQMERKLNVEDLIKVSAEFHPLVQSSLVKSREQSRASASHGKLPNFEQGDFVLVARDEYGAGDKLLLRWRGPRWVIKSLNDFVYQVEDLRTGHLDEIHATRLKFYRYDAVDERLIMDHVLQSDLGMPVARLMDLQDGLE